MWSDFFSCEVYDQGFSEQRFWVWIHSKRNVNFADRLAICHNLHHYMTTLLPVRISFFLGKHNLSLTLKTGLRNSYSLQFSNIVKMIKLALFRVV